MVAVLLLLLLAGVAREAIATAGSAGGPSADELAVLGALRQIAGATVQQGSFDFFTQESCNKIDTCYAENPLTPYGLAFLPRSPTEQPGYPNWCAHGICSADGLQSPSWRVTKGGEAILLIGIAPPECTYWSITPYMYSRVTSESFKPHPADIKHFVGACQSGQHRCEMFFGVNDPLNLETAVSGGSGEGFEQPIAVLIVFDSETEVRVKAALTQSKPMQKGGSFFNQEAGMAAINTLRIPGGIMNLGVSSAHDEDDFMLVTRVEGIKDPQKQMFFVKDNYLRAYRITLPPLGGVPPPLSALFPSFERSMRPRITGLQEGDGLSDLNHALSHKELQRAFDLLGVAVQLEEHRAGAHVLAEARLRFSSFVKDSGYECLHQGLRCQGDCRDTIYAVATLEIRSELCVRIPCPEDRSAKLAARDSFIVIGVQHHKLRHAKYASLTMYNYPKLASIQALNDGPMSQGGYDGTAELLLPSNKLAEYLYAVKFSRNCAAQRSKVFCVDISHAPRLLAANESVVMIERLYLHPTTLSGPAVNETILPLLLHVSERSRSGEAASLGNSLKK